LGISKEAHILKSIRSTIESSYNPFSIFITHTYFLFK